jgi:two-component system phosphate regulon response regulator PhoB
MDKYNVLIVEDEVDILKLLRINFEGGGFRVLSAENGFQALDVLSSSQVDLVILDLMLPGKDGLEVCKELRSREATKDIPVIMLTAKGDEVDRIVGLELGADDYVVKPFSPRELLLRAKAVLRRGRIEQKGRSLWEREGVHVDFGTHKVLVDGKERELTATEFRLLAHLIHSRGKVQTRDQLLNKVWGYEFEGYARTVDTHVRRLRHKLEPYSHLVETVRGVGYRLFT